MSDPLTWVDPLGLAPCSTKPNIASLPKLQGKSVSRIQRILKDNGYRRTNPNNLKNEKWVHPDGSEVQIHKYGGDSKTPYRSGNNAHVHKDFGKHGDNGVPYNDRGVVDMNPDNTHIGVKNPADFPVVSGRNHGD